MSHYSPPTDLFGAPSASSDLKPLRDPVTLHGHVLRDQKGEDAVLLRVGNREAWVPRRLIRYDGLGEQRVQIERWKAREQELL